MRSVTVSDTVERTARSGTGRTGINCVVIRLCIEKVVNIAINRALVRLSTFQCGSNV